MIKIKDKKLFCYNKFAGDNNIAVVGHTRQSEVNVQYLGGDISKSVIYIDCGKGFLQGFNLTTGKQVEFENPTIQVG